MRSTGRTATIDTRSNTCDAVETDLNTRKKGDGEKDKDRKWEVTTQHTSTQIKTGSVQSESRDVRKMR